MTEEQILAGAEWLGMATNSRSWAHQTNERKIALLKWAQGVLAAAEGAAPAPRSEPVSDPDRMWRALVEVSSS